MSLPRVDAATPGPGLTPPAPGHVQVIPLGGVGEIGKNMWCVRTPGGVIVLTVKNTLWDAGFAERIAELEARGAISRLEETRPYASMPGEGDTVPSRCLALRVS